MPKRLYPIFREAAEYTLIPYWKNVFLTCADGKLPKQMAISKGMIYVNKGGKCLKYAMPTQPQQVLTLCKMIFETVLDIKADQEKQQDVNEYNKYQEENCQTNLDKQINTIKDVRKKEDKLKLIDEYVIRMGNELNFNLYQKQRLKYAILTGLDLKIIKDIDFDNSKITKINGLLVKKSPKSVIIRLTK